MTGSSYYAWEPTAVLALAERLGLDASEAMSPPRCAARFQSFCAGRSSEEIVRAGFVIFLAWAPEPVALKHFARDLARGKVDPAGMANTIMASAEFAAKMASSTNSKPVGTPMAKLRRAGKRLGLPRGDKIAVI